MKKISFTIIYIANSNELLAIQLLNHPLGNISMTRRGDCCWWAEIEIDESIDCLQYRYCVISGEQTVREEWGGPHSLTFEPGSYTIDIHDHWQEIPANRPLYTQAFTESINRRTTSTDRTPLVSPARLLLGIEVPVVSPDETVLLAGSCDYLGNWDTQLSPEMNGNEFPNWLISLDFDRLPDTIEFKAVVVKKDSRKVVRWEEGENRRLNLKDFDRHSAVSVTGYRFNGGQTEWRGAGVAIPVFSLRSDNDFGIGDFLDLKLLIDWASNTHQQFVQILPINDTTMTGTWSDSYPYNATSTFALHPIYLRPDEIGELTDHERMKYFRACVKELNAERAIDYEKAFGLKMQYLRELFEQQGFSDIASIRFKEFMDRNSGWIKPYAAFCVLRDTYHTADFNQWNDYSRYSAAIVEKVEREHPDDMNFVYFLQFHLDRQLHEVQEYAHQHRVAIKGDIPIGISRTSVDAWQHPELFNLDCQAGAPPDDFSVSGQNWGFPTYNWDVMSRDGYAWWKARFMKMAEYFDAYRIDHVLGFFRIWQIPINAVHGLLGHFAPALPLSPAEMQAKYGFNFDSELFTHPYITDELVDKLGGRYASDIKELYLHADSSGIYNLLPEVDTQKKVQEAASRLANREMAQQIETALMSMIDEVLFIEDQIKKGYYHPRISGNKTALYKSLEPAQQQSFDRLYEDFFYHRHNEFWKETALSKLPPLIEATGMLTCAEDLGMIPGCVPDVLNTLKIIALDIQRMPKQFGVKFGDPLSYPYMTVCTTSTHDMSGIREWWEEDRQLTVDFYHNELRYTNQAPWFANPQICEDIVNIHLKSTAILTILPMQDWLSINGRVRRDNPLEERINIPANSRHYWRYRMHLTLEQLLQEEGLNSRISTLIELSGRMHTTTHRHEAL